MSLDRAPIGIVPIIFANDDLPDLTPPMDPHTLVSEMARLGFVGCQLSPALPSGGALRPALEQRGMRIAEVYAALPCTSAGPTPEARDQAFERLDAARRTDAAVLIFSYHLSDERVGWSGRANQPGAPTLTEAGRSRAVELIHDVAREAKAVGCPLVYHPHTGTFVETPAEVEWLMESTDADLVGLCLDVLGVVRELGRLDYGGWLMCEQDTTWRPPAESAAISRAVLGYAIRLAADESGSRATG